MSTTLANLDSDTNKEVDVVRFFGGNVNGTMLCLTQAKDSAIDFSNVKLTKAQAAGLRNVLDAFLADQ